MQILLILQCNPVVLYQIRTASRQLVGSKVANEKFKRKISTRNSVDITLRLGENKSVTRTFKVKGVIEPLNLTQFGEGGAPDRDNSVFIPISTMSAGMLNESDYSAFVARLIPWKMYEKCFERSG